MLAGSSFAAEVEQTAAIISIESEPVIGDL